MNQPHTVIVELREQTNLFYRFGRRRKGESVPQLAKGTKKLDISDISDLAAQTTRALALNDLANLQQLGEQLYNKVIPDTFGTYLASQVENSDLVFEEFSKQHPEDSGWKFPKGKVLTCSEIEQITSPGAIFPRLIVANSCDSARSGETGSEAYVSALYHSFLSRGVQHYIGTIGRVPDHVSQVFSRSFYEAFARGRPIGEALFTAREIVSAGIGWAFYVHYGDPTLQLTFPEDSLLPVSKFESRSLEIVLVHRKQHNVAHVRRSRELQEASECIERLKQGSPSTLLVEGEAGAGKSVFLTDILEELRQTVPATFCGVASCKKQNIRREYVPLQELLQSFIAPGYVPGPGDISATVDDRVLQVIVRSPQLFSLCRPDLLFAGDWPHVSRHLADKPTGAPVDKVDHYHLERELHAFISALGAVSPIVISLEDLQWADETSLDLFFHLGSAAPLLKIGSYRSHDMPETLGPRVRDAIRRGAKTISLDFENTDFRRAAAHAVRYLRKVLPVSSVRDKLGRRLVYRLVDYSGGNSFFQSEVISVLRTQHGLERRPTGAFDIWLLNERVLRGLYTPFALYVTKEPLHNLTAVIEERLEEAGEDLRTILAYASIQGRIFSLELLAQLMDTSTSALAKPLAALQERHRLITKTDFKISKCHTFEPDAMRHLTTFMFQHEVVMDFLHEALNSQEPRFPQLHSIAGEYLETICGEERGKIAAQLSDHFYVAGNENKALDYSLMAAKRYRQDGYETDAYRYFQRSLQLADPSNEFMSEFKGLKVKAGYGKDLLQDYFGVARR